VVQPPFGVNDGAEAGGSWSNASEAKKLGVPAFSRYLNSRKSPFFFGKYNF
jgi:hypothetical protein